MNNTFVVFQSTGLHCISRGNPFISYFTGNFLQTSFTFTFWFISHFVRCIPS